MKKRWTESLYITSHEDGTVTSITGSELMRIEAAQLGEDKEVVYVPKPEPAIVETPAAPMQPMVPIEAPEQVPVKVR